eukprot:2407100-Pyramimonas_sp.AAC.1
MVDPEGIACWRSESAVLQKKTELLANMSMLWSVLPIGLSDLRSASVCRRRTILCACRLLLRDCRRRARSM